MWGEVEYGMGCGIGVRGEVGCGVRVGVWVWVRWDEVREVWGVGRGCTNTVEWPLFPGKMISSTSEMCSH